MSRFMWNRQWTLILALGACLSISALTPRHAVADPALIVTDDGYGNGGGGSSGLGDPDVPDGAGRTKTAVKYGALSKGSMVVLGSGAAGDGGSFQSAVMWRLYIAWLGYRSFWFRF